METLKSRLHSSRQTLGREGGQLAKRTRTAGHTFARQTRKAGTAFARSTGEAGRDFARAMASEAGAWSSFARDGGGRASAEARELLTAREVERRVLGRLDTALTATSERLRTRLARLSADAPKPATPDVAVAVPFRGYDELTAREVVAELASLPAARRERVIAYERAHKARATVLRAAQAA